MKTNKKHFNRLAGGAVLLAGAMAFSACSSDEDFAEGVTPGTGVTGETVKTQFSIAVPGVGSVDKRLADETVQVGDDPTFRGMKNMRLVPVKVATTPSATDVTPVADTDVPSGNVITLALGTGDLTETTDADANIKYHVYNDVEIPLNTNAFLFYGEGGTESETDKRQYGSLVPSYYDAGWSTSTAFNTIHFDLDPIYGVTAGDEETRRNQVLTALNAVAGATGWSASTDDTPIKELYDQYITMKAGSSNSVRLALQQLYNTLSDNAYNSSSDVVSAIRAAIESHFTKTGDAPNAELKWTTDPNYPGEYDLPDGAVQVAWNSGTSLFEYKNSDINYGDGGVTGGNLQVASLDRYVYPASLFYWTNTALKTSTTTESANYSNKNWSAILNEYDNAWSVSATTQSVVLCQPIDYAVASFKLTAQFQGELEDNGDNLLGIGNAIVVPLPIGGFPLTAVLVGGQKNVGWNFQQLATDNTEKTIYDSYFGTDGKGINIANTPSDPFYTLALESKGFDNTTPETVRFALEFTNNSEEAFAGRDGIVPIGGKFYLVGALVSNNDHQKVFEQDHTTTATVTITSLQNAYNCIPDLRAPQLELGLAVDLDWEEGLEYDVVID